MKCKLLIVFFLAVFIPLKGQIVQPGQLDLVVYPGSAIQSIDNSTITYETELLLNKQFRTGTLCVNQSECYEGLNYNIDLLNRVVVIRTDEVIKNISFTFLYLLIDDILSKKYGMELVPEFNIPQLSELYFEEGKVKFFKSLHYVTLQPNYKPELDVGSKTITYVKKEQYYFVNEDGGYNLINRLNFRHISKNITSSELKNYLKNNKVDISTENDFVKVLETVYLK